MFCGIDTYRILRYVEQASVERQSEKKTVIAKDNIQLGETKSVSDKNN